MYFCHSDENDPTVVELWSTRRLQFEPKGWMYDMRGTLRSAIMRLQPRDNTTMHAVYSSLCQDVCDLENILLYNVGTGVFKSICDSGFLIERSFKEVPPPDHDKKNIYKHHHLYKVVHQTQKPIEWQMGLILAMWEDIPVRISSASKPHDFWYAMKRYNFIALSTGLHAGYLASK